MNNIIPLVEVERVRRAVDEAHDVAASRFRGAFEQSPLPPEERFGMYMQMRADALLEAATYVRVRSGRISYSFDGRAVTPYVVAGEPVYSHFEVPRIGEAIFEYFVLTGEVLATPTWNLTHILATTDEYDAALKTMQQPQLVDVTVASFLPQVDVREDGSALLQVTVYTRAVEERVERRTLALDPWNEFHFHSRALIAEGAAGVAV
jgi:hypothetical protein